MWHSKNCWYSLLLWIGKLKLWIYQNKSVSSIGFCIWAFRLDSIKADCFLHDVSKGALLSSVTLASHAGSADGMSDCFTCDPTFLLMCPGSHWKVVHVIASPAWSVHTLALAWPRCGLGGQWRSESMDKCSLSLGLLLLCLSNKSINLQLYFVWRLCDYSQFVV